LNKYKVPKKYWKKLTPRQKRMFNKTHEMLEDNQDLLTHPKTFLSDKEWGTIVWNVSWVVSEMLDE